MQAQFYGICYAGQTVDFLAPIAYSVKVTSCARNDSYSLLEIKPCGLGPRIQNVEAFWYKIEIKIIYFVPLCLIVFDFMVYPDPKFLIFKTKKHPHFF